MSREKMMLDPSRTTFASLLERPESEQPEGDEATDSIYAEEEEEEPISETRARVPERKPAPALLSRTVEHDVHSARKVARMKLNFYLSTLGLVLVNAVFFGLDYANVKVAGRYWFVWPVAFSAAAIVVRYLRAFVFRGRSLQGYIDSLLSQMEEREIEREL